jgi:hypothetical protein
MDDSAIIAIGVVAALVVGALGYNFLNSPNGPMAQNWRKRLSELEVQSRMGSPDEMIEALCESAKLYKRLGKGWEAETVMRRAVITNKQQYGEQNEGLAVIYDHYASLMDSMNRKKEAENMRRDAQKIRQRAKK